MNSTKWISIPTVNEFKSFPTLPALINLQKVFFFDSDWLMITLFFLQAFLDFPALFNQTINFTKFFHSIRQFLRYSAFTFEFDLIVGFCSMIGMKTWIMLRASGSHVFLKLISSIMCVNWMIKSLLTKRIHYFWNHLVHSFEYTARYVSSFSFGTSSFIFLLENWLYKVLL